MNLELEKDLTCPGYANLARGNDRSCKMERPCWKSDTSEANLALIWKGVTLILESKLQLGLMQGVDRVYNDLKSNMVAVFCEALQKVYSWKSHSFK